MSSLDPRNMAVRGALNGLPQVPTLGDLFGGGPQPVAVSPASPAPMRPGVDIRPVLSPQAMAPAEQAVGDAEAANAARTAEERFAALYGKMREKSQAALRTAEQEATVDPEQQVLFDQQQRRIETDRSTIERDKKLNDWDSLADLGFTMARSNSPFFATALTEGLQAGSRGLSASRMERARQRALLADREDQIAQARYAALKAAQNEARAKVMQGVELAKADIDILSKSEATIEKMATSGAAIKRAIAEADSAAFDAENAPRLLEADLDYKAAATEAARAAAENSRASANYTRRDKPGGRGSAGDYYDRQDIDKAERDAEEARLLFRAAIAKIPKGRRDTTRTKEYQDAEDAKAKAIAAINHLRRIKGLPPGRPAPDRALNTAPPPTADPLGIL